MCFSNLVSNLSVPVRRLVVNAMGGHGAVAINVPHLRLEFRAFYLRDQAMHTQTRASAGEQ